MRCGTRYVHFGCAFAIALNATFAGVAQAAPPIIDHISRAFQHVAYSGTEPESPRDCVVEQLAENSPADQGSDVIDVASSNAVTVEEVPAYPVVKPAVTAVAPEQAKQLAANLAQTSADEVAQSGAEQATDCYTLGPFRDLDNLRGLTREIKSYVVKADFRGREEKEQTLYWVYVKPEKTRKKAIETGKRLKARKIKDFYVIRDGEKENGLSLGHFRNKEGAYGLAKKVQILGFDVIVEPVFRSYTIYWLDYQLSSGVSIPESIFEKYIKSAKKNKISRLSRDCAAL